MLSVQKAKTGNEVTLSLKIGKLILSRGDIRFDSEKLTPAAVSRDQNRSGHPGAHSQLLKRNDEDETSVRSLSPLHISMPNSAVMSPRNKTINVDNAVTANADT